MTSSWFKLTPTQHFSGVQVTLPPNLSQDQLLSFRPFKTWLKSLSESLQQQQTNSSHPLHWTPYYLRSIEVQSVDFFGGGRIGFLKIRAVVSNDAGEILPGSVFMRGGSVAMLIILAPSDSQPLLAAENPSKDAEEEEEEEYVILTIQPRIPACSLSFVELPAGMLDDSGTFAGAAAKEIKEETGLDIREGELVDLTQLAVDAQSQEEKRSGTEEHLAKAVWPSPGGSDEFIPILMARKKMERKEIEALKGKLTGLRADGEKITLKVVRLRDVWKVGARDGKTLAAVALFEGLRREGKL